MISYLYEKTIIKIPQDVSEKKKIELAWAFLFQNEKSYGCSYLWLIHVLIC
jgi:hypothetical protein